MSTNVSSVASHFPSPQDGFSTTASAVSSGATSVTLAATGGYNDGDIVTLVIDPTDATKKQVFTGELDTATKTVNNVVWTSGTNQDHAGGATVVDYATATHIAQMTKGILVQHKQSGAHADTITTNTINENTTANGVTIDGLNIKDGKLTTANSVVTDNITNSAVATAKIADDAVNPTKWTNPYNFRAYHNTTQTSGSGSFSDASFNTEVFDTNGNFATSVYTVPVNGIYMFGATMRTDASNIERFMIAIVPSSGGTMRGSELYDSAGDTHLGSLSTATGLFSLSAGDTVKVQSFGNGAANIEADTAIFWGFLVHAT